MHPGRAALLLLPLSAVLFARAPSAVQAQPRSRDASVRVDAATEAATDAAGDVRGDVRGDVSGDVRGDAGAEGDGRSLDVAARTGARDDDDRDDRDEAPPDPCPPPRAVVDRAGHCCQPGQRAVGDRCTGAPTSCAPGESRDRAGSCAPRPPDDLDGGVSARLGPPSPAAPVPGMVRVPGGTFRAAGQWVSVGPFLIDVAEVSATSYRQCVAAGVCLAAPDPFGQMPVASTAPAVNVTWHMAARYCGWAGGRLPTEHEWELAARGIDGRRYPWGERAPDCSLARHAGCGDAPLRVGAAPAGRGPFGLLDAAGNVAEWTADRFGPRGGREGRGVSRDPTGAERGRQRVVRGGSLASVPADLTLDQRLSLDEREARADLGFRCARGL